MRRPPGGKLKSGLVIEVVSESRFALLYVEYYYQDVVIKPATQIYILLLLYITLSRVILEMQVKYK